MRNTPILMMYQNYKLLRVLSFVSKWRSYNSIFFCVFLKILKKCNMIIHFCLFKITLMNEDKSTMLNEIILLTAENLKFLNLKLLKNM